MLSDEEREALKILKAVGIRCKGINIDEVIINLIEKQSKEIEELKEKNKILKSLQNDTNGLYIEMTERKNYFERELQKVEDKIKAKIIEIKNRQVKDEFITASQGKLNTIIDMQSLLEKE